MDDGEHTISYFSIDNSNNEELAKEQVVFLDNTAPSSTASVGNPQYGSSPIYLKSTTPVSMAGEDSGSGLQYMEYKIGTGGSWTSYLSAFTLALAGAQELIYRAVDNVQNLQESQLLPLFADDSPPVTTITPTGATYWDGATRFAALATSFTLSAVDEGCGVYRVMNAVDGGGVDDYSAPISFLNEGPHSINYYSEDNLGNAETSNLYQIITDITSPSTTILIGDPQYQDGADLVIAGATPFTLSASDQGAYQSGLNRIEYRIDGGSWTQYAEGFTLAGYGDGYKTVQFRAIDNVGNTEETQFMAVLLDETPPEVIIATPKERSHDSYLYAADTYNNRIQKFNWPKEPHVTGLITFIGTIADLHFNTWTAEYGQGASPTTWTPLESDRTDQIFDSTLFQFDFTGLSGLYTFRINVSDKIQNTSSFTVTVTAGAPQVALVFGTMGTEPGQFKKPVDVTTDQNGYIYVADTENNRVEKFGPQGNFILEFGLKCTGHQPPGCTNQLSYCGVSPDGYLYVTDTYNDRVQKFDSSGVYISEFGTRGSGPGELNQPSAVAFDSEGNIWVSDTQNDRIQKFDQNYTFLFQFGTHGNAPGQFNEPAGIAFDEEDNIYVSDNLNDRVQVFDKNGTFLSQITGLSKPYDISLDSIGNIYISDVYNYEIAVHDRYLNQLVRFGDRGSAQGDFKLAKGVANGPGFTGSEKLPLNYPNFTVHPTGLSFSNPTPVAGVVVTISCQVFNIGIETTSAVIVDFYADAPGAAGTFIGSASVSGMAAGASAILQTTWDTTEMAGEHRIYAVVDAGDAIPEHNEDVNAAFKLITVLQQ
jgi:sugar lactone lactonase YvrE